MISSAVFEDMGHVVVLDGDNSHILLRMDGQDDAVIPLRCEGRLRYLDYLVPDDATQHEPEMALLCDMCFMDEVTDGPSVQYLETNDDLNHVKPDVYDVSIHKNHKASQDNINFEHSQRTQIVIRYFHTSQT